MERAFKSLCCVEGSLERVFKSLCCVEGSMERVFKSLCWVLHFVIQNYCMGCIMESSQLLQGGAYWNDQFKFRLEKEVRRINDRVQVLCCVCTRWFKMIALVGIMDCLQLQQGGHFGLFSSSSEKETRRRMDGVFKLLCCVLYCCFKILALKCRMGCSISLHGNAFQTRWWFIYGMDNQCIESGHFSILDCCIRCIVRLFMVLHGSVCWMVSWCYNGLLTVIVSRSILDC